MRILLTNDDGIDSVGLHVLARAMRPFGEVVIAAPDREFSGAGAALGADAAGAGTDHFGAAAVGAGGVHEHGAEGALHYGGLSTVAGPDGQIMSVSDTQSSLCCVRLDQPSLAQARVGSPLNAP